MSRSAPFRSRYARMAVTALCVAGAGTIVVSAGARWAARSTAARGELVAERPAVTYRCKDALTSAAGRSAEFILKNRGDGPVTILSARSGCGCASPIVSTRRIGPGESAKLTVAIQPLSYGEKVVPIDIETDAPRTPTLQLELRMIGSEEPPFLLKAGGELVYRDAPRSETRDFHVQLVEPRDGPRPEPILKCDLPFVNFTRVESKESPSGDSEEVIHRRVTYRVHFSEAPPDDFSGKVAVSYPNLPGRVLETPIRGDTTPEIRVAPSRVVLRGSTPFRFVVLTRSSAPELRVSPVPDDGELIVERLSDDSATRSTRFAVRRAGGAVVPADRSLAVQLTPDATAVVVPISMREE